MDRNSNSFFSNIPQLNIPRSGFDRSCSHKTTFSSGKLIPIFHEECLPADSVSLDTSVVCRMTTPIFPVLDNCFLDIYYFFVPNRLLFNKWKQFMGEDNSSLWEENPNIEVPVILPYETNSHTFKFDAGSLADYFGLPVEDMPFRYPINSLAFKAYYLIWNEYFRAQAVQDPVWIPDFEDSFGIEPISDYTPSNYVNEAFSHLALMPVGKFSDYFVSCLPSPQVGEPVFVPLNGSVPVITSTVNLLDGEISEEALQGYIGGENIPRTITDGDGEGFIPSNLYADLSRGDFVTINDLRSAIAVQQFLEAESRGGSRYTEIIQNFFGVTSPDARLQRPEYIGGKRIPINVDQVVQTSSNNSQPSPLGSTGAFSLTGDRDNSFTYSATEHGHIIGLCCVRPQHTYQRGIERKWSRRERFDYYFPMFDNIGEQPVYLRELNCTLCNEQDDVFGYNEAWADYRYSHNKVTGGFRFNVPDSLSSWVYTDEVDQASVISNDFIVENPDIIGSTLAYVSNPDVQFLADFYFKQNWYRPMNVYSEPGLYRL